MTGAQANFSTSLPQLPPAVGIGLDMQIEHIGDNWQVIPQACAVHDDSPDHRADDAQHQKAPAPEHNPSTGAFAVRFFLIVILVVHRRLRAGGLSVAEIADVFEKAGQRVIASVTGNAVIAQNDLPAFYCPSRRSEVTETARLINSSWTGGGNDYGACAGAGKTLKFLVERHLKDSVDEQIRVIQV